MKKLKQWYYLKFYKDDLLAFTGLIQRYQEVGISYHEVVEIISLYDGWSQKKALKTLKMYLHFV